MRNRYCKEFGFDSRGIKTRLQLIGLGDADLELCDTLQKQVIIPNIDEIIEQFYVYMLNQPEMLLHLDNKKLIDNLKKTQTNYLLSLGKGFNSADYFEERLRVGLAHAKVRIPPFLYICAYRRLTQLIYEFFPENIKNNNELQQQLYMFVAKITALDMSLAIETYHHTQLNKLEISLETLRQEENHLRHLAETDLLTGVPNYAHVVAILDRSIANAHRDNEPLCVMMADIDFFKQVNDSYGHLTGDSVLREVSKRLRAALRDLDVIGRYGGEEFLVIFTNTHIDTAYEVAERTRKHICESPINLQERSIDISISLGLCGLHQDDDINAIIERADRAMYLAKNAGRNCSKVCTPDAIRR
ncbi:diguanylate cyclase/phosphodiesterase (GGDEF & EAL domains) with PAS/PAC sensor(s) [hydrothermal vent metagenome]|uniref:Diguanylate cyclase DosC n=1 Tax=hydrothermal vent metagenome TaxID=652676 RepID=A0A3B0Z4L4_9ZZZZ